MALLDTVKDKLKQPGAAWQVRLYVKDGNDEWVLFSDTSGTQGTNRLVRYGAVSLKSESKGGAGTVVVTTSNVVLRNDDGFFDSPFPSSLKTSRGNSASFSSTKSGSRSVLFGRPVQLRAAVALRSGEVELVLGTFLAGEYTENVVGGTVDLKLENYALPLRLADSAEKVKDGLNWFANRPVPFLLRQLLARYNSSGVLPTGFQVPDRIRIETNASRSGASGDPRRLSTIGRLPLYDGTTWFNSSKVVRALLWAPKNPDVSPQQYDALYYGADDELWRWDPTTETDTKLDDTTLGAGYKIRKLFFKSGSTSIWGIAFPDRPTSGRTVSAKLFEYGGFPTPTLTVRATITNLFSGLWCYRDGRLSGGVMIGNYGVSGAGENVPLPFDQRVFFTSSEDAWFERVEGLQTTTMEWNDGYTPAFLKTGYYTFVNSNSSFTPPANLCHTMGQRGFFEFVADAAPFSGTEGSFVYAAYDSTNETIKIRAYSLEDIGLGPSTLVGELVANATGERLDPLCGTMDGTNVYVTGIYWDDGGATNAIVAIRKIGNIGGTPTNTRLYYSEDYPSDRWRTPLDMVYDAADGGNELKVSLFDRKKLGRQDAYSYGRLSATTAGDISRIGQPFESPMAGLVVGEGNDVFMVKQGSLSLWVHDKSTNTLEPVDDAHPAVEGEAGLSAGLIREADTNSSFSAYKGILYGVSRPTVLEPDAYDAQPVGKYSLFKLDRYLSDRIELADFSGLSAWKAVELLAQAANHLTGFAREGNFFFVPRTLAASADLTIQNEGGQSLKGALVLGSGEEEILNVVRATPYASAVGELETTLKLAKRAEEDDKEFDGEIVAQQRDNLVKRVELQCVKGGKVSDAPGVWFRWRSFDEKFETRLAAAYTAGATTMKINSGVDSIRAGDTVRVVEGSNEEEATVSSTPTDEEVETGTLNLVAGLSNSYTVDGAFVEITKVRGRWSDRFLSLLSNSYFLDWTASVPDDWTYGGAGTLTEDTVQFLFGHKTLKFTAGATDDAISQDIAASDLKANTWYSFQVYARAELGQGDPNTNSTARVEVSGVDIATASYDRQETQNADHWVLLSGRFKTDAAVASPVTFKLVSRDSGRPVWFDGAVIVEGSRTLNPYIVVGQYDEFIPVGDTEVELLFRTPSSDEHAFLAGDRILVRGEGLHLEKMEQAVYTAIEPLSVAKYGRRELEVDNRFLNRVLASEVAEAIRDEFAYPVFLIEVETPLLPWLDFVSGGTATRVDVRDRRAFKNRGGWRESCFVRSITDDPRRRSTRLLLRASSPY